MNNFLLPYGILRSDYGVLVMSLKPNYIHFFLSKIQRSTVFFNNFLMVMYVNCNEMLTNFISYGAQNII